MLWTIDVGNTRTVSGLLKGLEAVRRSAAPTSGLEKPAGARRWARALRERGGSEGVIVSSVVPRVEGPIRKALAEAFGTRPVFVDPRMDLGMRVKVRRPSEVGADRLMNALAARTIFGPPCIVADFGTATTFDVVDRHGDYAGGAILPGLRTSFRALHAFTARLPETGFVPASGAIGRSTVDAMRSGIWFGSIGQVRELLLRIRKELGVVAPAYATGGDSAAFEETGLFQRTAPDLTWWGMAILWKRIHE